MATNTYVALHTNTVTGSAVANYTYSSIPATYTDLVCVIEGTASSIDDVAIQFNGDTATNYSLTFMYGNGSATTSGRAASQTSMTIGGLSTVRGSTILHIMDYANTTTVKTVLGRTDVTDWVAYQKVGLWRKTPEAINSIKFIHSGNFQVGTTFNIYGILANGINTTTKASGGTITQDAGYFYHTFTAGGDFIALQTLSCDYLLIGGGGSGGSAHGGGGGGGGLLALTGQTLTANTYAVTVGAGGTGRTNSSGLAGNVGTVSTFNASTAPGGGGGGARGDFSTVASSSGASGGGGAGGQSAGSGSAGTTGGSGGNGTSNGTAGNGGGGGGAGGNGSVASGSGDGVGSGGAGGVGSTVYTSWALATSTGQNVSGTRYYAGGGGGGAWNATGGAGGSGGGGAGSGNGSTVGVAGTANTGGGSGGGGSSQPGSGNGGSGIVIVRYLKA